MLTKDAEIAQQNARPMAERACNARMQLVLIDMHALETEQWTAENRPTRRLMKV